MSLISKDAVKAAFDNADPDVMADYGTERDFSRSAVNRILITAFASEKHFEPGQPVWVVERDDDGDAYDVSGYIFLAEVADHAILFPYVNEQSDMEYLLNYHRRETNADYDTDLLVVLLSDCFASKTAAHHALDEEQDGDRGV